MHIQQICSICSLRKSSNVCILCGKQVCTLCLDRQTGLCSSCRIGKSINKNNPKLKTK